MTEAKAHGKLRLEGKEYIVQDGDVLNIRFTFNQVNRMIETYP